MDIIHFKLHRSATDHLPNISASSLSRRLYELEVKTHFSAKASLRTQYTGIPIRTPPLN